MTGGGPAVICRPGTSEVSQSVLGGYDTSVITAVAANQRTLESSSCAYDAAADRTRLTFSRALAVPANAHTSERPINATQPTGFIYAVGSSAAFGFHQYMDYVVITPVPPPVVCTRQATCSGRGTCALVSGTPTCRCDFGAQGGSCSTCAAGFRAASSASGAACEPDTADPAASTLSVGVTLTLSLNISAAGAVGTPARATFVQQFAADVATALNTSASRVNVTGIRAGSIIVDFTLLPSATGSPAHVLAAALVADVASPNSRLAAGTITSAVNASVTPTLSLMAPGGGSGGGAYTYTVSLTDRLALSWRMEGTTAIAFRAVATGAASAWFAVGVNSGGLSMPGSDVIAWEFGRSTGTDAAGLAAGVNQYAVSGRSNADVRLIPSATSTMSNVAVSVSSGTVTVSWTRTLAAGSYAGAVAIPATGTVTLVYAMGSDGQGTIARHDPRAVGGGSVNFATGAYAAAALPVSAIRVAHGAIMTMAWGVLIPTGIFLARFTKHVHPTTGPAAFWFHRHWIVQCVGAALSLLGFALAVAMVPSGSHFTTPHHVLGLVVVLLGVIQPLNAKLRPHKPPAGEPVPLKRTAWEWLHRGLGYVAAVLTIPTLFLGLAAALAHPGIVGVMAAWVAVVCAAFIVAQIRLVWCPPAPRSAVALTGKPPHDDSPVPLSATNPVHHNTKTVAGDNPILAKGDDGVANPNSHLAAAPSWRKGAGHRS